MTRKNNNRTENKNTRKNTAAQAEVKVEVTHVETDKRIEPAHKTDTQLAAEKASKEAEKEAKRKQAQEQAKRTKECDANFDAATMTPNDAFRAINAHRDERIHEDGTTVASLLAEKGLTKLNFKALKAILPASFIDADGCICMPTVKCAMSVTEDPKDAKSVYYFVVNGKGKDAKRTFKKAQIYGFSRIDLWTPAVIRRLLNAALAYAERQEHYAKRNAEVKAAKQFFIVNEVNENSQSNKVADKATRVTTYTRIDSESVNWPAE